MAYIWQQILTIIPWCMSNLCCVRWALVSGLFSNEWLPQTVSDIHESIKAPEAYLHPDSGEIACDPLVGNKKWYELLSILTEKCEDRFMVKIFDACKIAVLNSCFSHLVPVRLRVSDFASKALRMMLSHLKIKRYQVSKNHQSYGPY